MSSLTVMRAADVSASEKPELRLDPPKLSTINSDLFRGVRVTIEVRLGRAPMTVDDVMALKPGSLVPLETGLADHVELYLNDILVARGEIVAVGDKYGVRVTETAAPPS